jgi:Tfp pilus assembly protein PilX
VIAGVARAADIRPVIRGLVHREHGQVLMLALLVLLILSLTTAALLTATALNHRSAAVSADQKKAFSLAEQGLAYAEGRLYTAPTTAESVLVPGTSVSPSDGDGMITYSGTLCTPSTTPACSPKVWTLYGTGSVDGVSRTVSAQVTIPAVTQTDTSTTTSTTTSSDFTIWHYIYLDTSGCTTFSGNLTINVPLYLKGCMNLTGSVKFTGSDLEVGGNLSVSGAGKIGSSSQRISKMNVAGSCSPAPCDGSHNPIWVNVPGVGHTLTPTLTKPTISLPTTYANANPGPALGHACQAGSNVPANFFDNDTTLNNSNGNVYSKIFPSGQSYDCKVGSNEIKWDGVNKLFVSGTFYFDGSLSMTGNNNIVYTGEGTLYFTSTMSFAGTTSLCGIVNCTTQWDTGHNVLVLVAGCQNSSGGSISSGCVSITGTNKLQVGIYSNTDYSIAGTAVNMGPVIATNGSFSGNATQMIPFATLPAGAPAMTTTTTLTETDTTTTTYDGNPETPSKWNG